MAQPPEIILELLCLLNVISIAIIVQIFSNVALRIWEDQHLGGLNEVVEVKADSWWHYPTEMEPRASGYLIEAVVMFY